MGRNFKALLQARREIEALKGIIGGLEVQLGEFKSLELVVPLPAPIERAIISGERASNIIRSYFPTGDIHLGDPSNQEVYKLCDIEDIEAVLDVDQTNHLIYVRHGFDCENFAAMLWGQFNSPAWAPFCIGYMWTDVHGMICAIDANEDLWMIEPQNDERRSGLLLRQGQSLRFVIM